MEILLGSARYVFHLPSVAASSLLIVLIKFRLKYTNSYYMCWKSSSIVLSKLGKFPPTFCSSFLFITSSIHISIDFISYLLMIMCFCQFRVGQFSGLKNAYSAIRAICFDIITYYIEWVKNSWTYNIVTDWLKMDMTYIERK